MASTGQILAVARLINQDLRAPLTLQMLARRAGISPSHLQREFKRVAGESPARYARRLRLRAALALLRAEVPLTRIARETGFASVEVLIRNFRAEFGCTPGLLRRRLRARGGRIGALRDARVAARVAACAPFFHLMPDRKQGSPTMPMLSAELRTLAAQPALVIRSRVPRSAIAATIGESLGRIAPYALGAGGAFTGQPFARYPEFGPGTIVMEVGMPLAAPLPGQGDIEAFTLPAGLAAVAVHAGRYEEMPGTYEALEKWLIARGRTTAGPPWEVYVSDPAEHPDPADWRTEIVWPVS